ncbi:MAG: hypothetical protein NT067_04870 [Candidatus Diapherotrites archaeon]|nr:hypothetical protein [Candidatus Diapherotrites archaeon]
MAEKMIISLVPVFTAPKGKRARRAMRKIRVDLEKRFHADKEAIFISAGINHAVFEKGFIKIPRRIAIMVESEKGKVRAFLEGEKLPVKKEEKKEKKEEKKSKEEKKEDTEEQAELERKKKEKHEKELAAEKTAIKLKTGRV